MATEGVSFAISADNGVGVIIEVNSQTDFVAKNEVFQGFVKDVANVVATDDPADVEALKTASTPAPTAPSPTSPPTRCWPSARTSRSAALSATAGASTCPMFT